MTTLTPVQQSAYDDIKSHLEDGFWSGVNEDDLNAIRTKLYDLGSTDVDAVVDAMAESGLLKKFAEESNASEFLGAGQDGFSKDERLSLFADFARNLDAESLVTVSNTFAGAETGETDFRVVTELADAVATHSSSSTKLDYIRGLSGSTESDGIETRPFASGATITQYIDSEAGAISTVLGSMSGSYAQLAFESLDDEALANVMETSIDKSTTIAGASVTNNYDATRFEALVRAAATTYDPALKARVFDAAGEQLGEVLDSGDGPTVFSNGDDELGRMTDAMEALIDSDTTGIMKELTYASSTEDGTAMTHFAEAMIKTDNTEGLSDIMLKLQFGENLDENAVRRLDEVTTVAGQDYRENAGALGYFVGSVYAGAADHSDDVKAQQEAVTGFLDFVAGKIPLVGGQSLSDAALGQDLIGQAVEQAINDPGLTPAQRLELAALPHNENGRLEVGDDITSAFDTTINRVRRAQE